MTKILFSLRNYGPGNFSQTGTNITLSSSKISDREPHPCSDSGCSSSSSSNSSSSSSSSYWWGVATAATVQGSAGLAAFQRSQTCSMLARGMEGPG